MGYQANIELVTFVKLAKIASKDGLCC